MPSQPAVTWVKGYCWFHVFSNMRDRNGTAPWRFPSETSHAMMCRSNTCLTLAVKVIDYWVVKLNDSLFLFCDMDAWGAFYKATGRTTTVVSLASRLLTNATLQLPLAENLGGCESSLSKCFLCFGYAWVSSFRLIFWKGKWKHANLYIVLMGWALTIRWPYHKLIMFLTQF